MAQDSQLAFLSLLREKGEGEEGGGREGGRGRWREREHTQTLQLNAHVLNLVFWEDHTGKQAALQGFYHVVMV